MRVVSVQTVTTQFHQLAKGEIIPLSWRVLISFAKNFDPNVTFFTIGVSSIGGPDIIPGDEGDVIQEWDKYDYVDYSDRVISFEWERQQEPLGSATMAMADITLDNWDGIFNAYSLESPLAGLIRPYRPIKIYAGYNNESIPMFFGLTEKMPEYNTRDRTVTFHCIDFMHSLMGRSLDESVMLVDKRTDEIIDYLLQLAGLTPTQYVLDTGFNTIGFYYQEKGKKIGDVLLPLVEAEQGRIFMDERGTIRFHNRQNRNLTVVDTYDQDTVIDIEARGQDDIINVVEVKSQVREVQAKQKFWELQGAELVPAGGTLDIWADFQDPVTTADDPVYVTSATTSSYTTNVNEDGSGSNNNAAISVTNTDLFAQSMKITFSNSSGTPTYITTLEIYATPAKVVKEIYVREEDATSVTTYDERIHTIENNNIQNETDAQSIALTIINNHKDFGGIQNVKVVGDLALQIKDRILVTDIDNLDSTANVIYLHGVMQDGGLQMDVGLDGQARSGIPSGAMYFTIGVSSIGGGDIIAP